MEAKIYVIHKTYVMMLKPDPVEQMELDFIPTPGMILSGILVSKNEETGKTFYSDMYEVEKVVVNPYTNQMEVYLG